MAAVHREPVPGTMTIEDLKAYTTKTTDALCNPYRDFIVCVPPRPPRAWLCCRPWRSSNTPT
ncbi:MAG: hypothetical protein WDN45_12860 [Caulobacteraceae bacterium]